MTPDYKFMWIALKANISHITCDDEIMLADLERLIEEIETDEGVSSDVNSSN